MKIISLNINDFGGSKEHLMHHQITDNRGKKKIDWGYWKSLDKHIPLEKLLEYLKIECPSILLLQEFEINNSKESVSFHECMLKMGYSRVGEIPQKGCYSITIMYINGGIQYESITNPHKKLSLRASAIKTDKYLIYGTHVPPIYNENFWDELTNFYKENKEKKIILMGDFNTYSKDTHHRKKFEELFKHGAIDVWLERGNPDSTPTEKRYKGRLDYVIVSPQMYRNVISMTIEPKFMTDDISDHAALILEIS